MIKNWKIFLESNESDLDLIKDIMTELEDEYGFIIDYDDTLDDQFYTIITISSSDEKGKNDNIKMVDDFEVISDKIDQMLNGKYEIDFKLIFYKYNIYGEENESNFIEVGKWNKFDVGKLYKFRYGTIWIEKPIKKGQVKKISKILLESVDDQKRQLKESMENLKDSLSELTDWRECVFTNNYHIKSNVSIIDIFIRLEDDVNINDVSLGVTDLSEIKKFKSKELISALNLLKEGLIRSQIEYKESRFWITFEKWSDYSNEYNDHEDCYIITIRIKI